MAEIRLIPGYRFDPFDDQIVCYLKRKVMGEKFPDVIAELDIYEHDPCELPGKSRLRTGELEWYFFCPRKKKYHNGNRFKRSSKNGYWKVTGKDRDVLHENKTVGKIKSLVFYKGKSQDGTRTDWVMHEYRLEDRDLADKGIDQDSYVVCKVFRKDGLGPRNRARYGRPINEEEWDNEELGIPYADLTAPVPILFVTSDGSVPNGNHLPASANPSDPNVLLGNAENFADGDGAPPSNEFFEGVEYFFPDVAGLSSGQNTDGVGTSDESDFRELIRIKERISYCRLF